MQTYYRDADGDGHGAQTGAITRCGAPPSGYITGPADDCYDANADAYPGQTTYFAPHRGDGSHDYNCNGSTEPRFVAGAAIGIAACSGTCPGGCSASGQGTVPAVSCGSSFSVYRACACTPNCSRIQLSETQRCR